MLDIRIRLKILEIINLSLEKNNEEKNTIFFNFMGHCEIFEVSIHSKGWKNGVGADFFKDMFLARLSQRETEEKLDEIIEELEKLKVN